MQEHSGVFLDACRKAVTKEHLSFPVWLQEEIGLDDKVHRYIGTYQMIFTDRGNRGKEGKWERGNERY